MSVIIISEKFTRPEIRTKRFNSRKIRYNDVTLVQRLGSIRKLNNSKTDEYL